MRLTPRRNLLQVAEWLAATLLLLAGTSGALAQPVPGKESPEEVCKGCHIDYVNTYSGSKHGTKSDLRTPANSGGCLACHGDAALEHAAKGGGRGVGGVLSFNDKKVSSQTKNEVCLACHRGGERVHWDGSVHQARDLACTSCHQVHTQHDKVRERLSQTEVCFGCHKEQRAMLNRPSRHPIAEGKVVCSDCHNPHGSVGPKLVKRDSVNDTCYQCHMEKRGPFVHNHEPVSEDCMNCHNPHGTVVENMLKARAPFLCHQCHTPHGPNVPQLLGAQVVPNSVTTTGKNAVNITMARGCLNCHTAVHGSNNPSVTNPTPQFRLR